MSDQSFIWLLQAHHAYEEGGTEFIGVFRTYETAEAECKCSLVKPQFGFSIRKVEIQE